MSNHQSMYVWLTHTANFFLGCVFTLLIGCGEGAGGTSNSGNSGGSGGSSGTSNRISLSGTAATGAAITNSAVNIKCSNGNAGIVSAATVSNVYGSYSYSFITSATAPCMVQVQITNSAGSVIDTLHGMVSSASPLGTAIVNITPLTEAVMATALAQEDLASYFNSLSASQISGLVSLDTATAWTNIQTKLTAVGISHSAITNPLSQPFSANGTGYDSVLDAIKAGSYTTEHLYRMGRNLTVPPVAPTGILNDTGLDWCSENITSPSIWVNNIVCSTFNWVGNLWGQQQDAFFGRDAAAKAGTLTKIGTGFAGFDYTRIGSTGKPLKIQNATWSDSGNEAAGTQWDCVRDNTTGLMWEVKRKQLVNGVKHLRHMDHRYGWYSPNFATNGGSVGYETATNYYDIALGNYMSVTGATCTGVADTTKCNTQSYVDAVNAVGMCGYTNWRIPNVEELRGLAHTGRSNAAIDPNHFPNTQADITWSSSAKEDVTDEAWYTYFYDGTDGYSNKYEAYFVRLVRSGQ